MHHARGVSFLEQEDLERTCKETEMTRKQSVLGFLALAMVVVAAFKGEELQGKASAVYAAPAAEPGVTAKVALAKAREKARAWQSDARLEKASTGYADGQGKIAVSDDPQMAGVTRWEFVFSSEKGKKVLLVETDSKYYVETSDFTQQHKVFNPLPEDFVDSDRVMAETKRNGFAPSAAGNAMVLAREHVLVPGLGAEKFPEPVWVVSAVEGGDQFIVSATTGKFVSKRKGEP